ncbi:MAG: SoxR reducing system RseC family protein [Betaproteobacteria bacterium]|nr:SoxR reducing system RseC family protein [Betaproteobacteria bacterium]
MGNPEVQTIRAIVRAIDGEQALVEVEEGGCGRCHETGGCGGQNISRALCGGPRSYRADNAIGARVGEHVTVAIGAGAVRRSANLAYVFPLFAALAGAVAGTALAGEGGAIAGTAGGLFLGFVRLRRGSAAGTGYATDRPHLVSRSS